MKADYSQLALEFGQLLGLAHDMHLKLAHMTRQGMELVLENATTRAQVRFLPKVYSEGKVIVDAINDLAMVVEVIQSNLADGKQVGGGKIELPFSTWFFEGDYI